MQGLQISLFPYLEIILKIAKEKDFNITHDQLGLFTVQLQEQKEDVENTGDNIEEENESCISPKNNIIDAVISKSKEIILRKPYIKYSDLSDTSEFTVSFGDWRSYPFCTCTYWKFYKLPCVHVCAVCCKLPGWRYQMFSSLYRSNPIFDIDYSCLDNDFQKAECDVDKRLDFVTGNIFESFLKVGANDVILNQSNDFLQHVNKMMFLFKDKHLYSNIRYQLQDFVERLKTYLTSKDTCQKLLIPSSLLQSRSDSVASSVVNSTKMNKSTVKNIATNVTNIDRLNVTKKYNRAVLPRLQPISADNQSKYIVSTLENTSSNKEKIGLDLINFEITTIGNAVNKNTAGPSQLPSSGAGTENMKSNNHSCVHSMMLGKRLSSNMNFCTANRIKRKHMSENNTVDPPCSAERIFEETCVKISSFIQ